MRSTRIPGQSTVATLCACALGSLLVLPAVAAGFDDKRVVSAERLVLRNLIGAIRVEGHDGPSFEVTLHADGADATRERIEIALREGTSAELAVRFPLDESRDYVYPEIGSGRTRIQLDGDGSWLSHLLGNSRGRIEVTGSGRGLELWVDATVRVPRGAELEVDHGVGSVEATGVDGTVTLSTHSGRVQVDSMTGRVVVDTGSGHVTASSIEGDLTVDTGSGHVEVRQARGAEVIVDTGSGSVDLEAVDAGKLVVDTGSGGVSGQGVGADRGRVDTGSGSVDLDIARLGHGDFDIDTGSGGIRLRLPADASAAIHASTGSGGINVEDPGNRIHIRDMESDEAHLVLGDGATRMDLDTGSGGIRISVN